MFQELDSCAAMFLPLKFLGALKIVKACSLAPNGRGKTVNVRIHIKKCVFLSFILCYCFRAWQYISRKLGVK